MQVAHERRHERARRRDVRRIVVLSLARRVAVESRHAAVVAAHGQALAAQQLRAKHARVDPKIRIRDILLRNAGETRQLLRDSGALGSRERIALRQRRHVIAEGKRPRLLHDLLQRLLLQLGRELLVVPGRGRVRRQIAGVREVVGGRRLDVSEVEHRAEEHDAIQLDPFSRLELGREARRAEGAVALAVEILGRRPAAVLIEVVANELREEPDVVRRAGEVRYLRARSGARIAGHHRIDLNEVRDVERRHGIVDEVVWRRGLRAVGSHLRMARAHESHVEPDRR